MVDLETLADPAEVREVKTMIATHLEATGSLLAERILGSWEETLPLFVKVMPRDYRRMLEAMRTVEASGLSGEAAVMAAFELNSHELARVSGN
jgi:glutamate synthase (ferredoxin)